MFKSTALAYLCILVGQVLLWIDINGRSPNLQISQTLKELLQNKVLQNVFISNSMFQNSILGESKDYDSGPIFCEFTRGLLQLPVNNFLSLFEKITTPSSQTGDVEIQNNDFPTVEIQGYFSNLLKTLLIQKNSEIIQQQLKFLRQQHVTLLELQPQEAVLRNEAKDEEEYLLNKRDNTFVEVLKLVILVFNSNQQLKQETIQNKIKFIRDCINIEITEQLPSGTRIFVEKLKKLNQEVSDNSKKIVARATTIPASKIFLLKQLGKGNFGEVYKGFWENRFVAVKRLIGTNIPPAQILEFQKEAELIISLEHPSIVRSFGIVKDFEQCPFAIVLEFAEKGSLDRILRDKDECSLGQNLPSWDIRKQIAYDIASAVTYLHSKSIVHGDLRACNVLVDKTFTAKLGDFGLAKQRAGNMSMVMTNERTTGVVRWLSPELIKTSVKTLYSDIYSYGMILWEIMTGNFPFHTISDEVQLTSIISSGDIISHHNIPSDAPTIFQITHECLQFESKNRPEMSKIAEKLTNDCYLSPEEVKTISEQKNKNDINANIAIADSESTDEDSGEDEGSEDSD